MSAFLLLYKLQTLLLIVIKAGLLLKYFLFKKYRQPDWKTGHIFYFPVDHILLSRSPESVIVKRVQNIITVVLLNVAIVVVLLKLAITVLS